MIEVDPGHYYILKELDGDGTPQTLIFVKREGPNYPGNKGHYAGTTMQEVLRALVQRAKYVNKQIPCEQTEDVIGHCEEAIWLLEERAAIRHGRLAPSLEEAVKGTCCDKCGHVGCQGDCH